MRNLKRALSLLLAAVMLIGMMVVSASAVSYNDFSDSGEIVNKDAVSMLTTLGIIEGQPDGSYNPTGDVDRAQMAKMISVALTNNEDCDTLYQNVNSGLTDISANWARGFINYCYVRGIIAGRGNNTFDPSANVTGVEAAKMLLTALGYDADIEGLVGPDWALNTAALAQQLGIFRNFTKDVNANLNRDDAALLIYNALDVEMIQQYQNGYALAYADHRTILSSVFGVIRVEGVVVANEWARLEETDSDAALRTGKTTLENVVWYDSTTANTVVEEGVRETQPVTFNVTTPVDYMGQAVTMYVEKTTILSNSNVIGVAANDELNVVYATADGADDEDDLLDGTGIELGRDTEYYVNYGYCEDLAEAIDIIGNEDPGVDWNTIAVNGVEVEVIDNDDDGTAEYVLYTAETLSEVVRYNERDEILTFYKSNVGDDRLYDNGNPEPVRVDFADVVSEDEIATDDVILYVEYGGRTYVKLADYVTGTMTRLDRDRNDELYITIDNGDENYQSFIRDEASDVDVDIEDFDIDDAKTRDDAPGFDTLFDFFLDSNGFIVANAEISNNGKEDSTAGVGDNGDIVYADYAHANNVAANNCDLQYVAVNGYKAGSGSILVSANGVEKTYAVDRNTLAFYYWGEDDYEVLTGWNEMSSVPVGTHAQVYPVLTKTADDEYEASNLAGVIVFEAETEANKDNYLFVLSRNAYTTGNDLWLNVVFEDGTVEEIEVDNYDVDFDRDVDFMTAYSYSQNSDGTYDLESVNADDDHVYQSDDPDYDGDVYADLLRVGTVAYYWDEENVERYISYVDGEANVWDVTGMTSANDEPVAADFRENVEVHAVIVDDDDSIRTAWIWDVEEEADDDAVIDYDDLYVTERTEGNIDVYTAKALNARQVASVVRQFLNDADIASVEYTPASHKAVITYVDDTSVEYNVRVYVTTESVVTAQAAKDVIEDNNYTLYWNGASFYDNSSDAYANNDKGWAGADSFTHGLAALINSDLADAEDPSEVAHNTFAGEGATQVGPSHDGSDGGTNYYTYSVRILDGEGEDTEVDATVSYKIVFCDVNA